MEQVNEGDTIKDFLMELYLKYGEREFDFGQEGYTLSQILSGTKNRTIQWVNGHIIVCDLVRLTPEAIKLIKGK